MNLSVVDGADPAESEIGVEGSVLSSTPRTSCHILGMFWRTSDSLDTDRGLGVLRLLGHSVDAETNLA